MIPTPAHNIPVDVRKMATAIHEAGHALVAIIKGRQVTGAILRPNGLSGETQFRDATPEYLDMNIPSNWDRVNDAIVALLAGQVAEAEYWKKHRNRYNPIIDSHRHDDVEIC